MKLALPARRHTGHRRPPPQADESPSDIRASARDAQASAFRPSRDRDRCARELRSTVTRSRKKRIPRLFAVSRFRSPSEFPHVSLIHAPGRPDGKLSVRRVRARYRTGIPIRDGSVHLATFDKQHDRMHDRRPRCTRVNAPCDPCPAVTLRAASRAASTCTVASRTMSNAPPSPAGRVTIVLYIIFCCRRCSLTWVHRRQMP